MIFIAYYSFQTTNIYEIQMRYKNRQMYVYATNKAVITEHDEPKRKLITFHHDSRAFI